MSESAKSITLNVSRNDIHLISIALTALERWGDSANLDNPNARANLKDVKALREMLSVHEAEPV
jgi:hypothetical protein